MSPGSTATRTTPPGGRPTPLPTWLEYRFSPTVTLSGFVNNVTDRLYATESQPDMVVLGDPRSAWLTVKVAF